MSTQGRPSIRKRLKELTREETCGVGASLTVFLGVADGRPRGLRAVLGEVAGGSRDDLQGERRANGGLRFCFLPQGPPQGVSA